MEIPYSSFLSSSTFEIDCPGGKSFLIHSALIATLSRRFDRAVNGNMKESQEHRIQIQACNGDIDDGTVMQFIEWAYTGDYTTPDDESEIPSTEIKPQARIFKSGSAGGFWNGASDITISPLTSQAASPDINVRKTQLWERFTKPVSFKDAKKGKPPKLKAPPGDCANDLLCHARLYVFSNQYECEALGRLALEKLRSTLTKIDVSKAATTAAVIILIEYAYTYTQDYPIGFDQLRALVLEFIVCHLEKLTYTESFQKFMENHAVFTKDLMIKSMARLE